MDRKLCKFSDNKNEGNERTLVCRKNKIPVE